MLVTISIIGILAGMLLVGLGQAKRKVQTVMCMSNLKQLGLAVLGYMGEFDKPLPDLPGPHFWMLPLQRYAQIGEKVRTCPSTKTFPVWRTKQNPSENGTVNHAWLTIDNDSSVAYQGSYARNMWIHQRDTRQDYSFTTEASFGDSSRLPVFADSVCAVTSPEEVDLPARNLFTGDQGAGITIGAGLWVVAIPRHSAPLSAAVTNFVVTKKLSGAVNVVFADYHAETVKLERLWSLQWHRQWPEQERRWSLPLAD